MSLIGQPVTIIGAGVAGLAAARALALRGAQVTVLEQADAIREVGAGLQISPNGACVLRALGLQAALDAASMRAEAVQLIDGPTGDPVTRLDLVRLRPDQGYHFLHRADLIQILLQGATEAGVTLRLLSRVAAVDLSGPHPAVTLESGERIETPLLVGADGLHSRTRTALNGAEQPFFTHQVAWRAVIPCEPGAAPVAEVHMGPGRHLVSYPLRGGTLRNIVAVEERAKWAEESWTLRDDSMDLRLAFEGFSPRVRTWLDRVEDPWLWGLFRHTVAQTWVKPMGQGGVALLGDAAHPTLPFLAQGASMGLEDAWLLAQALATHDTAAAAFAAYQSLRIPRTSRIVAAATANARAYHLSGLPRMLGHAGLRVLGRVSPGRMLSRFEWLYGHDVTQVS
ncbi:MAG: FAD-dependent monooxygenase [Tabrizicola sp.]|uniref:FAD-dependent oxidoreductase n=1 Tax=Tabrizicola sp. TaxID=2005166 RepID=UPI002ABB4108|nr:FAD-dependent oxidoreductase [Tabrizicola sp.]MDZ4087434.1 FAD-dependent monooxygenase [Tabrizicola sp.]